jgi:hypothetical protein
MTELEATQFVTDEIASRYKTLPDATRGDWMRAVKKADSIDTARKIVRAIVDDPETTLCVKAFYKGLRQSGASLRPEGEYSFIIGEGEFEVFAVTTLALGRLWRKKLTYPTHRRYENGTVTPIPWTAENLMDAMQSTLRFIRETYGGDWWLEIKNPEPELVPEIGGQALSGRSVASALADKLEVPPEPAPDGRRVAAMIEAMKAADTRSTQEHTRSLPEPREAKTGPGVPLEGDRPTQTKLGALNDTLEAGRDMVKRVQEGERPKGKLPEKVSGQPFDPKHDKELQDEFTREPGEEG